MRHHSGYLRGLNITYRLSTLYRLLSWLTVVSTVLNLFLVPPTVSAQENLAAQNTLLLPDPVQCVLPSTGFSHQVLLPFVVVPSSGETPENRAPIALDCSASLEQGTILVLDLHHAAYDLDLDPLTFSLSSQPTQGSVALTGRQITYTAAASFVGQQTFAYQVADSHGKTASAQVRLTITARNNDAPTANPATRSVEAGKRISLNLSTLASDPNGDQLTYRIVSEPDHGIAQLVGATLTYTPTTASPVEDSLIYGVSDKCDGRGNYSLQCDGSGE